MTADAPIVCPKCGYARQPGDAGPDSECPKCGIIYAKFTGTSRPSAPVSPPPPPEKRAKGADEKFCSECGEIIKSKAEICPKCGVRQLPPPDSGKPRGDERQKLVAGLLALFLGGLGAHKFYLGRGGQGVIYLLLCWTFVPAILGLIEGLNYLTMSQRVFDQRYNS